MKTSSTNWTAEQRSRIQAGLQKVLDGRSFSAAPRLQNLLRYLVTETLDGRGDRVNQSSIAIDVQGKDADFDPNVDSQVRVEAGRLRAKLREYYEEEGRDDEIRFELPKGLYQPRIRFVADQTSNETAPRHPQPEPTVSREQSRMRETTAPGEESDRSFSADTEPASKERGLINEDDESLLPTHPRLRVAFVATIALSLLAAIAYVIQQKPADELPAVTNEATETQTPPSTLAKKLDFTGAKSLAVLPFLNSSATSENAGFFADGLHDDLLTQLTKIADLKVISRTSVMGYRDTSKPITQIAEELGVHTVLEGAVQRAGDRIRVNVQLIDGRTDQHIWAETFDQQLNATNVFEIQRQIATQIAAALQAKLSPEEESRLAILPTHNFEAYESYLKGRQLLVKRTLDDMAAATDLFNEALAKDPEFALAYVGLAESAYLRNVYGGLGREEMFAIARPALEKAFAINDQIGEAWTVEGALRVLEENSTGAEDAFKRAIALNPNYAQAYHWYGSLLEDGPGRKDEALKMAQRAKELDPLSPLLRANLAESLENEGRLDEALAELKTAVELNPDFEVATIALAYHYLGARGDVPTAMQLFAPTAREGKNMDAIAGIALSYQLLGELPASGKWVTRYAAQVNDPALRSLQLAMFEYANGEDKPAAAHAGEVLKDKGKYLALFRTPLLGILRNLDLREGRGMDAKARYLEFYPEMGEAPPRVDNLNLDAAVDLALVYQKLNDADRAKLLLDGASAVIKDMPRLGKHGYGIADVEIAALRGDRAGAIAAMRRAVDEGWLLYWWELPATSPNLELVRDDPEFQVLMKTVLTKLAAQSLKVRELEKSGVIPFG